jgi:diguanylate cyclase (GGDEF)-like protein
MKAVRHDTAADAVDEPAGSGPANDGAGCDGQSGSVPPPVAARLLHAFDRSRAAVVMLLDADLKTRWISQSAKWVLGVDPASRIGRPPIDRVHPEDVERIVRGVEHLKAASKITPNVPVVEPVRYRIRRSDGEWHVMEALVHNLLDDPDVQGFVLVARPVGGHLDGVGHVVDLLVANAPLPEVLAACAGLVGEYLGQAAIVALVDGQQVIGAAPDGPVAHLVSDDRWWHDAVVDGEMRTRAGFDGFPEDLARAAQAEGFRSVRVLPLLETSTGEVMGCIVVWLLIDVDVGQDISPNEGLRQTARLANLVIGEQRRHRALRREALTDPLTAAGNRSALRRRLDAAADPVTVALVDLDDFKLVNDTHGHDAGDVVLREVAARLLRVVREDDLVARFGGDEFAVVFADGTPAESIDRATKRVADAIAPPIRIDATSSVSVRASIGVATAEPSEVVRLADAALYRVKRRHPLSPPSSQPG